MKWAYSRPVATPASPVTARPLTAAFGDLGGSVPDALRQLEADPAAAYFDSVSQIALDGWSRNRVVLLGDAAWCVTLFAGYGAALALDGVDRLGASARCGQVAGVRVSRPGRGR